ncbi:hypothetical protein ASE43_02110 [Lysobacter sp. Root983]|nr:hypothetical protein ASE43_02110 [Lysobacter sp. Root983]
MTDRRVDWIDECLSPEQEVTLSAGTHKLQYVPWPHSLETILRVREYFDRDLFASGHIAAIVEPRQKPQRTNLECCSQQRHIMERSRENTAL